MIFGLFGIFVDVDYYFVVVGEFNGIGDQVGEYLVDMGCVFFDLKWYIVLDMGDEFDVFFFGVLVEQVDVFVEYGVDIKGGEI